MISQKNQRRIDWVLNAALLALVFNLAIPVHAETNSHPIPVVVVGENQTKPASLSLPVIPNKPPVVRKKLTVRSSAYSSTKDQTDNDPFTTASGSKVHDGIVAMNGIPFGTKIRIPQYYGDKVFTVEDRMHAKWGKKRVDIWMTSRQQAREWGVRTVNIEILS